MKFSKIKFDGVLTELTWTSKLDGAGEVVHTLKSTDTPRPEFIGALKAMVGPVLEVLELENAGWEDSLSVSGLSINEEEDGRRGLVCTCRRPLDVANAPLIINTPHLREFRDDEALKGFMPDELYSAMEAVEKEAALYLKGKRAQSDLFDGLIPDADSGIESVTISSGDKSVTLKRKGRG